MFTKQTIYDIDLKDKTVLIRTDFNVPLDDNGVIVDDYRIRQSLPTIEHVRSMGAKIVIISHLGRPISRDASLSLAPVAIRLSNLLHLPVKFSHDCIGQSTHDLVASLGHQEIVLLENLRFYRGEEANDEQFAKALASLADVFIQDGFGITHRAHASTVAITHFIPSVAGLLLAREYDTITNVINQPKRPLATIIGGAKISDKIELLNKLVEQADYVAVVGAMANTFLMAEGIPIGDSLVEKEALDVAKAILAKAHARMQKESFSFCLPSDVVVAREIDNGQTTRVVDINQHTWSDISVYPKRPKPEAYCVQSDERILDIGPMSAAAIAGAMKLTKTAIWNGPAGVVEIKGINGAADPFSHGTKIIMESLVGEVAKVKNKPYSLVAGGDTAAYIATNDGLKYRFDFISTGGGACLALLSGNKLPGVEALLPKDP